MPKQEKQAAEAALTRAPERESVRPCTRTRSQRKTQVRETIASRHLILFSGNLQCAYLHLEERPRSDRRAARVHRANGALHSVILCKQPVIVFRPNETWCRRRDRDFQLVVETLEGGEGRYAFGVWARPGERGRRKE